MRLGPAVVITPIFAILISAAVTGLVSRQGAAPRTPTVDPRRAAVATPAVAREAAGTAGVAASPSPPPGPPAVRYEHPVGYELAMDSSFLERWGIPLVIGHDGPPVLFLLSSAELNGERYGWEMPALAEAMARELSAVLDEGCRDGCSTQAGQARARLQGLADTDARRDRPAQIRRWRAEDDGLPEVDHREITFRTAAGRISLDVVCRCVSQPLGMRMWNDFTVCDASLLDRGRLVLRYAPRVELASDRISELRALEAYRQTVSFPDGEQLIIESGYDYTGDDIDRPREKTEVRGSLRWSKPQ